MCGICIQRLRPAPEGMPAPAQPVLLEAAFRKPEMYGLMDVSCVWAPNKGRFSSDMMLVEMFYISNQQNYDLDNLVKIKESS